MYSYFFPFEMVFPPTKMFFMIYFTLPGIDLTLGTWQGRWIWKKKCWNLTSFEGITSFSAGLRLGAPLTLLAASTKPSFVWNKRGEIRFILWLPALCSSSIQSSLTPPLCDDMRVPGPLPAARSQRGPSIWPRCSAVITGPFNTSNCSTFDTLSRQLLGIIPV